MKNLSLVLLFIIVAIIANAADYPFASIPDSLKKNANAVKRYDEMRIEIESPEKAKLYTHYATTILNEAGNNYADYVSHYDKFTTINYISGTLCDAYGKEIKHIKAKDMKDEATFDGYSLMGDDREKKFDFYRRDFPYTVEYEEEDDMNGIFALGYWMPQENQFIAVEYSKLVVVSPANLPFRYKQLNYPGDPVITLAGNKKIYTWEIKNVPAKIKEPYAPSWNELVTSVSLAPTDFKIGGYTGNMNNWSNYGLFVNTLLQGRDQLPDALKQKVHELTDTIKKTEDKVNVLYHFLQENTRYISVQLGIGGWQPFDANYVYTNKYGDCKALSNFMVAMLKEAGIKANYVLITAGPYANSMVADFPSTQFNHATVCVPLKKDTLWLECTDQTMPADYISNFTGNRQALVMDEKGGHVVNTITYTCDDNMQVRNINAVINETGKLSADVYSTYRCLEQDYIHNRIHLKTKKEQLDELKTDFDIPTYDIASFEYKEKLSAKPVIEETLKLTADNYASISGKRMFITPNLLTQTGYKFTPDDDRRFDVYFRYGFTHIDTINISIPTGYSLESKPKNISLKNAFGEYDIKFDINENKIKCYRYFLRKEGRFPASSYSDLVSFYNNIFKADHSRFVFVNKEN